MKKSVIFTSLDAALQRAVSFSQAGASPVLGAIFETALQAVDPYNAVLSALRVEQQYLHVGSTQFNLEAYNRIAVIGAGKATGRMAQAIETLLEERIDEGLIVVKDGHSEPLSIINQVESSHPFPGPAGVEGTRRILEMAHAADDKTLLICLFSGGASALLVYPAEGLTLQDKQDTTRLLLQAGATIAELNTVRKHLSSVKGGRLAQAAYPAQLITLILSDVIGDPLDVIASGPTVQDNSSFSDAWAVIVKYGLSKNLPSRVADYLQHGMAGLVAETVKGNQHWLAKTHNLIIASNRQALDAAQGKSTQLGMHSRLIADNLQGEARLAATFLAQTALAELAQMQSGERRCLLCGGETTVTVTGNGKGGRSQELALAFALEIEGCTGVTLLSAGTDGSDGPTDAAGAIVDGSTASRARQLGIDAASYLDNNDSYTFFQQLDSRSGTRSHVITGPTGTNVMDIQIVLLDNSRRCDT